MALLVLLNGPPASGKSTLAARWIEDRPLALDLDIDVVRGSLGGWLDRPDESGRAARRLAAAMARTHLAAGHDVIVPQLLAREEFILELESIATEVGARFVEVVLAVDVDTMLASFAARSALALERSHIDAAALATHGGAGHLEELHARLVDLVSTRPGAHVIDVVAGDVDGTLALLRRVTG